MRRHSSSALLAAFATACAQGATTPAQAPSHSEDASSDLVLRDARLVRLMDGKTVAQVSASELRYRRDGGRFQADGVRANLLPGPQARALESFGAVEVIAPRVSGGSDSQEARSEGAVSARAARGDIAHGEDVVWNGSRKRLESDRPVAIEGQGYTLRGGGLAASTDGEHFELNRGAQGTVTHAPGDR